MLDPEVSSAFSFLELILELEGLGATITKDGKSKKSKAQPTLDSHAATWS